MPWTISACNVDADLMLICQDWASSDFLNKRKDPEQKKYGHDAKLKTNVNIKEILREHFDLSFADTYATDVFPFIKEGGMDETIPPRDLARSASEYALPQIEIVRPKMVICLGSAPFNAIRRALKKGKGSHGQGLHGRDPVPYRVPRHPHFRRRARGRTGDGVRGRESEARTTMAGLGHLLPLSSRWALRSDRPCLCGGKIRRKSIR